MSMKPFVGEVDLDKLELHTGVDRYGDDRKMFKYVSNGETYYSPRVVIEVDYMSSEFHLVNQILGSYGYRTVRTVISSSEISEKQLCYIVLSIRDYSTKLLLHLVSNDAINIFYTSAYDFIRYIDRVCV